MAPVEQWKNQARAPPPGARTLWVGDLEEWMNEEWMWRTFGYGATVTDVKVIRDKVTGKVAGYGFVEFPTTYDAEQVLIGYQGKPIANHPSGKSYKLNWATQGLSNSKTQVAAAAAQPVATAVTDYPIFVGDLAAEVTDHMLLAAFRPNYPSVTSAKVVIDKLTLKSKCFGFVRFSNQMEQQRAIAEMDGAWIMHRQIRCGEAQNSLNAQGVRMTGANEPRPVGAEDDYMTSAATPLPAHITNATFTKTEDNEAMQDPSNTTLFVGGLDPNVTDIVLLTTFAVFGNIVYCRVPPGKNCGFIQYEQRAAAEQALQTMNNTFLMGGKIRVNWGKAGVGRGNKPIAPGFQKLYNVNTTAEPHMTPHMPTQYGYQGTSAAYAHTSQAGEYGAYGAAYSGYDGGNWYSSDLTPQDDLDQPMTEEESDEQNAQYLADRAAKFENKMLSRAAHGFSWQLWDLIQLEGEEDKISEWDRLRLGVP